MKAFNDKVSQAILYQLRQNSRMSWQELGKRVHLSGQAVAERVKQMQDAGVIAKFTIEQQHLPRYFIQVKMTCNRFAEFEEFLIQQTGVESVDKVSGEYCYHIIYIDEQQQLEEFLQQILAFGLYAVIQSIRRVK